MKLGCLAIAAAALASPSIVMAQDAHANHEDHVVDGQDASVTDAEMEEFVDIVMQGRGVQNSDALSDEAKQAQMLSLITESDMGMARFMQVSQAVGADEALQQRVQAAVMQRLADSE